METLLGTETLPGTWSLRSSRQKSNRIGRGNMGTGPLMGEVRSWGKAGNKVMRWRFPWKFSFGSELGEVEG